MIQLIPRLLARFVALSALAAFVAACTGAGASPSAVSATIAPSAPASAAAASGSAAGGTCPTSQPSAMPAGQAATVTLETSAGPIFVIQGGDGQYGRQPNVDPAHVGSGGPGYAFPDDPVNVPYARATVAMANSGPNTNGSQFFIVLADAGLPPQYSVFGHVTSGMDVVDKIAAMPNDGSEANMALDPVAITKATVGP